ncbi:cardiolipin synthase [Bacillus sp. OV322]|uniref:cardiolipin synthase n=1 Tax=Bacillus sp. OV322 TaxID=1882764 RepID=UPI0008F1BAC1|nr:cardiolipin synthase [Bacillus sp. OV322]SFC20997.1 cardiolipin synthase [Bacillus sp. OV322]
MKKLGKALLLLIGVLSWLAADFNLGRKKHAACGKTAEKFPFRHSSFSIYSNGPSFFGDFFEDIRHAQKSIHIQFFTVKKDAFSMDFLQLLMEKAETGIEVRLLLDRIGSKDISPLLIRELRRMGVYVYFAAVPQFPFIFYSSQTRNHRKITIIDGKIGYLGGFNIGKEYMNGNPKLSPWRDYHIKITGQGVQDLQTQFLKDWNISSKEDLTNREAYFPMLGKGESPQQFVSTNGAGLEDLMLEILNSAKKHIIIGTPYFIPSKRVLKGLREVLARGIKITIIVPKNADHLFVKEGAYPYFRVLLREGAHIFQYQRGFYHPKILLADDTICDIGTANFDKRSLFLNQEINCLIYDKTFISIVRKLLEEDIQQSRPLTEDMLANMGIFIKIKERIAAMLSPFL